jgi:hypothetical protein
LKRIIKSLGPSLFKGENMNNSEQTSKSNSKGGAVSKKYKLTDKAIEYLKAQKFTKGGIKVDQNDGGESILNASAGRRLGAEKIKALNEGDKVRFWYCNEWIYGYCGNLKPREIISLECERYSEGYKVERYEWTIEDLDEQFKKAVGE